MPLLTVIKTAAECTVGANIMAGERGETSPYIRRIVKAAITGSTAIGDCGFDFFYGSTYVATLYNSTAGASTFPLEAQDYKHFPANMWCKAGEPLQIMCIDAADTQQVVFEMLIEETRAVNNRR